MRADRKRPNHLPGQPNAIFENFVGTHPGSVLIYDFQPAARMLQGLEEMVADFGKR